MKFTQEVKVGIVVVAALVTIAIVYNYLGRLSIQSDSYKVHSFFSDVKKLNTGSDIRMSGVIIGTVEKVSLASNGKARVDMLIWNQNKIPVDSEASATSGGLIGDTFIDIKRGDSSQVLKSGENLASRDVVGYDQVIDQLSSVLGELKTTADGLNDVLGDRELIASFKDTIKSFNDTTKRANELIVSTNDLVQTSGPEVKKVFANLEAATQNAQDISVQLEEMIARDARPQLKAILHDARTATASLNTAINEARPMISNFNKSSEKINSSLDKLDNIAGQTEEMLVKLNDASEGVRDLATDTQLKADMKRTMKNAADASEEAKVLLRNLNEKVTGIKRPDAAPRSQVPEAGLVTRGLWNSSEGKYRLDANYTFSLTPGGFYRLGMQDISEENGLNLQAGNILDDHTSWRYGIYSSRLGVGFDRKIGYNSYLSLDAYRPNEPRLDVQGTLGISDSLGLYGGVADVFEQENRRLLFGMEYRH